MPSYADAFYPDRLLSFAGSLALVQNDVDASKMQYDRLVFAERAWPAALLLSDCMYQRTVKKSTKYAMSDSRWRS